MKMTLPDSEYSTFISLLRNSRFPEAFHRYLDALETMFLTNGHTQPQVHILKNHNVPTIDYFVEVENNARFYELTNIRFPYDRKNESAAKIKQQLLKFLQEKPRLQSKIRNMYQDDLEFFKRKHIDVGQL